MERLKKILIFIVTPIAFVIGYVYFVLTAKKRVEDDLLISTQKEKLSELKGEEKQIDARANDAVAKFQRIRDAFLSGRDNVGGRGDSGKDGASGDKR